MAAAVKDKADKAAAAAAQAAAAAKPTVPPGFDPLTGKRILTPDQQIRRDFLIKEIAKNSADAAAWNSYGDKLGYAEAGLTAVEKAADIAIDVGATLSPVGGAKIKNIYAATKTITKSMSESYAKGESVLGGAAKGALEAGVDKALDTFGGALTDKFGGKIPGFGKFESAADYGTTGLSEIRKTYEGAVQTNVKAALKNALQGQAQGSFLWDPFKKFFKGGD